MPITFHYDDQANILYEKGTGSLTLKDFMEYREKLKSANLKKHFRSLADYSEANLNFSTGHMQQYAESFRGVAQKYGNVKIAICVRKNLEFGLARMYANITEENGYDVEVFRDYEKARKWLLNE
jgi:hypothetical protein